MNQRIRKRIKEGFGWIKTVGGQRKTRFRGRDRVGWAFAFMAAPTGPPAQAARSPGVSVLGKWRIIELPGYEADYADMVEPAYILFDVNGGEFAFGCVTGAFAVGGEHAAVEFHWNGNEELDEARNSEWAELQADDSLRGEFGFHDGDEIPFIARRWPASSTACSAQSFCVLSSPSHLVAPLNSRRAPRVN